MATPRKAVKNPRKTRKTYSPKERAAILAEAKAKRMTGREVAEAYGISMVTYYLWRKKAGASSRQPRGRRVTAGPSGHGSASEMRKVIKERVRMLAPAILREEVLEYLAESLGRPSGRGKRG
jgi:transposase-like protein